MAGPHNKKQHCTLINYCICHNIQHLHHASVVYKPVGNQVFNSWLSKVSAQSNVPVLRLCYAVKKWRNSRLRTLVDS